jgi:hypothetical protein
MKSKVVSLLVLWVLALYPGVGNAQTSNHSALTVKVPFDFVVGSRTLPAGIYEFELITGAPVVTDQVSYLDRNIEGRVYHAVVTDIARGEARLGSRIVFTKRRDRHLLSEVWEAGSRPQTQQFRGRCRTGDSGGNRNRSADSVKEVRGSWDYLGLSPPKSHLKDAKAEYAKLEVAGKRSSSSPAVCRWFPKPGDFTF